MGRRVRPGPLTVGVLALALAAPAPPSRAQLMFPVAPDPIVLLVPLILTLIGIRLEMPRSDAERVRVLEARGDWDRLDRLIAERLAHDPEDLQWRELRGRSLQRRGRCADALGDLQFVFGRRQAVAGPADAAFDIGLVLASCQMAAWDLPAALATLTRLAEIAPGRWESYHHLAIARARLGDAAGAQAALAELRSRQPAMADALATQLADAASIRRDAASPGAMPAPAWPAAAAGGPLPATLQPDGRLAVGERSLQLPAGPWELVATTRQVVYALKFRAISRTDEVPVITAHAVQSGTQGVATLAAFSTNPVRSHGTSYWSAETACDAPDALYHERFHSSVDRPECLLVRRLDAPSAGTVPQLEPALRAALAAGLALPRHAYLVQYRRYGLDWAVGATFLLPLDRVAGDLAAVQWGLALAAELRPLGHLPGARTARTPALGPA